MYKDRLTDLFSKYKSRVIVNASKSGVVICNASSTTHIYFVAQDIADIMGDTESFSIQDVTTGDSAKVICEYDKEKDCLAFMESIQYRKVILSIITDLGIETAFKIVDVLKERNIKIEDDYFLDVQSVDVVFSFLFNAPLGRKPTEEESIKFVCQLRDGSYEVVRNSGEVKHYIFRRDLRTKAEKKSSKSDKEWCQLGFVVCDID